MTNPVTGTADNPDPELELFNVSYNGINCTDGRTVTFTSWNVGNNTMNLQVYNKGVSWIQVFLYVTDFPSDWIIIWEANATAIWNGQLATANLIITCPDNIVDGTIYEGNLTMTAFEVAT